MNAVKDAILSGDFSLDLKEIYTLKTKVADIAYKESVNQKTITDILDLWIYALTNLNHIEANKLAIIRQYTLVNRTLPTFLLRFLKQMKKES